MPIPARAMCLAIFATAAVSTSAVTGSAISTGAVTTAVRGADDRADVVIRGVDLVDVRQGVVLPARDIVVRGTRIASVQPTGGLLPPAKTLIDGRGKFALPGLIDAHVQLARFTRDTAAVLIGDGVTAVRDHGTDPARIAEWRRALAYGQMYAPRIARACGAIRARDQVPDGPRGLPAAEPGCAAASPSDASPLAALFRAGVQDLAGSRAGRPLRTRGPDLHDQLERLVRGGFTPLEALRAATIDTARVLLLADLGEVTAGMGADILITTGNPLVDIRNARAIDAVVFRGEPLTQAHLNLLRAGRMPRTPALPQARQARAGRGGGRR